MKLRITLLAALILSYVAGIASAEIQWQQIGAGAGGETTAIAFDPRTDNTVYMASDVGGVFRSDDGGKTWKTLMESALTEKLKFGIVFIQNISIDPSRPDTLFISTTAGIFKSSNRGEIWKPVVEGVMHCNVAFSPDEKNRLLSGESHFQKRDGKGIIHISTDGGDDWRRVAGTGIPANAAVRNVAFVSWQQRTALAATSEGLFVSRDAGETWESVASPDPAANLDFYSVKALEHENRKAYIVIARDDEQQRGEIYRSFDNGATWEHLTDKLTEFIVRNRRRVAYHLEAHKKTGRLYIAIQKGWDRRTGVWQGNNLGDTWQRLTTGENVERAYWGGAFAECVGVAPTNPKRMMYGNSQEVYRSDNGGKSWQNAGSEIYPGKRFKATGYDVTYPWGLVFDPNRPRHAIAHYQDIGKWYYDSETDIFTRTKSAHTNSDDFGSYHGCVHSVCLDPATPNIYYLSAGLGYSSMMVRRPGDFKPTYGKLVRVTRTGERENYEVLGKDQLPKSDPLLAIDLNSPESSRHLYATFADRGIYRSLDGGKTFEWLAKDINGSAAFWRIYCLGKKKTGVYVLLSKDRKNRKEAGLYRSFDGGETWQSFFDVSKYGGPYAMVQHPTNDKVFYVAAAYRTAPRKSDGFSKGGGVYRTDDDGATWQRVLNEPYVTTLAIDHKRPNRLLAGSSLYGGDRVYKESEPGVYYTEDGGKTWSRETRGVGGQLFTMMAFHPDDQRIVYAGTYGAGLHKGTIVKK